MGRLLEAVPVRTRVLVVASLMLALVPPALADALPDRLDFEGLTAGFTAASPLTGSVTWRAEGLPPGVSIGADGEVHGLLTYSSAGTYAVTLHATNATASWTGTFTWVVRDVNRPPTVMPPGLVTSHVGQPVDLQLRASDPDGDALSFAARGLPPGLHLDAATGRVTGVPTAQGLHLVEVVVSDSGHATRLSARFAFPWWVETPSNLAPDCAAAAPTVATLWPPNGKRVPVGVAGVVDPDGDAVDVRVDAIASDEPADVGGVGTSAALLPAERDGAGDGRVYTVSFTASDGKGGACAGSVAVLVPHDVRS